MTTDTPLATTDKFSDAESAVLALSDDATPDQIMEVMTKVQFIQARAKQVNALCKQRMIEIVEARGGELLVGTTLYHVGGENKYTLLDPLTANDEALKLAGGDVEAAHRDFYRSDPFKPGAFKKALPKAQFDKLFKTERIKTLEDGKPKLSALDTAYMR